MNFKKRNGLIGGSPVKDKPYLLARIASILMVITAIAVPMNGLIAGG